MAVGSTVVAVDEESDTVTPTLLGRVQTRIFLVLGVGLPWTLLVSPALPVPASKDLLSVYRLTLTALAVAVVVGVAWDALYYGLQQLRWDKDWPSCFGLLNGLNEGVTTWVGLHLVGVLSGAYGPSNAMFVAFIVHFSSTWILVWLSAQGPMRIFFSVAVPGRSSPLTFGRPLVVLPALMVVVVGGVGPASEGRVTGWED